MENPCRSCRLTGHGRHQHQPDLLGREHPRQRRRHLLRELHYHDLRELLPPGALQQQHGGPARNPYGEPLWRTPMENPYGEPLWKTPMENPCCGCRLTGSGAVGGQHGRLRGEHPAELPAERAVPVREPRHYREPLPAAGTERPAMPHQLPLVSRSLPVGSCELMGDPGGFCSPSGRAGRDLADPLCACRAGHHGAGRRGPDLLRSPDQGPVREQRTTATHDAP